MQGWACLATKQCPFLDSTLSSGPKGRAGCQVSLCCISLFLPSLVWLSATADAWGHLERCSENASVQNPGGPLLFPASEAEATREVRMN